ncbi:hypothetical protein ACUYOF_20160 [Photobacterium ganghwense]|uniref:hypothetical protein n=1 Tax=Photobacterium ganghwense TaxID=320778 RepID=UPI0040575FFB
MDSKKTAQTQQFKQNGSSKAVHAKRFKENREMKQQAERRQAASIKYVLKAA